MVLGLTKFDKLYDVTNNQTFKSSRFNISHQKSDQTSGSKKVDQTDHPRFVNKIIHFETILNPLVWMFQMCQPMRQRTNHHRVHPKMKPSQKFEDFSKNTKLSKNYQNTWKNFLLLKQVQIEILIFRKHSRNSSKNQVFNDFPKLLTLRKNEFTGNNRFAWKTDDCLKFLTVRNNLPKSLILRNSWFVEFADSPKYSINQNSRLSEIVDSPKMSIFGNNRFFENTLLV